ncbi:MAG TPA: hypothetical protein VJ870_01540 [Amycolatopsis sp.]|nr:hypothetical protein [Amycolatopsis sp.]
MVGVPGRSGGQNRKRPEQRLGNAKYAKTDPRHHENVDRPQATGRAEQPELGTWPDGTVPSPYVRDLWESMTTSGFHEYYTDADWRAAVILLFTVDLLLREMTVTGKPLPAMKSAELRGILGDLLVTESARRRLRIDVQRAPDAQPLAEVSHLELARTLAQ